MFKKQLEESASANKGSKENDNSEMEDGKQSLKGATVDVRKEKKRSRKGK